MKKFLYPFLVVVFFGLVLFSGNWGLTESSEARYATIAQEMVKTDSYINPTLMGIKHLHKPPVTYYITAFSYKIFGVNEFAARFFLHVALVFQLLLVFKISQLLFKNEKFSLLTTLIYFSFPIVIIAERNLTTDTYLTTFILATVFYWLQYKNKGKILFLVLFYVFLGLIFETKGPVGLVIPVVFVITQKIVFKDPVNFRLPYILSFLVFLIVASAWYIAAIYKNENLLQYFVNSQLIERVSENKFNRGQPFWYYIVLLPAIGFPWVLLLILYFKNNLLRIINEKNIEFVLLISFLGLFLILTLATSKLILYILPIFSILAIFSAKFIVESNIKLLNLISKFYVFIIIIFGVCLLLLTFIKIADLTVNPFIASAIFLIFSSISLYIYRNFPKENYLKPGILGVVFMFTVVFSANHIFSKNEILINSVKPMAQFLKNNNIKTSNVLVYNYLLPSISYYLNKNVTTINHGRYTTKREVQFENNLNWKNYLKNYAVKEDRDQLIQSNLNKDVFLIKRKKDAFPDSLQIIQSNLKFKKDFGKFEVYYNK
jgi:4-amino-4-deoxy-L-arabinose transferase